MSVITTEQNIINTKFKYYAGKREGDSTSLTLDDGDHHGGGGSVGGHASVVAFVSARN